MDEKIRKKLQSALKFSGFNVRSEFCDLIVSNFVEAEIDLNNNRTFDDCLKHLCRSLEGQCISEQSIEKENIERAIQVCLHSGYDKNETVFSVIEAFDFPRLLYDADRRQYFLNPKKATLLSDANSKASLFLERYNTILQRTKRNFKHKISGTEKDGLKLQTVDYLLTLSSVTLNHTLILGSLLQVSEGKFYLEDPTGIVQLNLAHAKYHGGFFVENCFVLVNGCYDDKILEVSTIILPPGEEYTDSRPSFGTLNYFGGASLTPLKDSLKLQEHLNRNAREMILFFSDLWLDNVEIFEKLRVLFEGFQDFPPIAFVFMGNFMTDTYSSDSMENLRKLFKKLGDLIVSYPSLVSQSEFVFVPGMVDPSMPHIVPRLSLPSFVTEEMTKVFNKAIFTTNPCRIQYCTKEIVVFRADILPKLLQGSLYKPPKQDFADNLTRTIISQGHLSPLSLNSLTTHWDFDYTLRLYPLPDLVVIGDKAEMYQKKYKECQVVNPGSFCSSFQFKSYTPGTGQVDDCEL